MLLLHIATAYSVAYAATYTVAHAIANANGCLCSNLDDISGYYRNWIVFHCSYEQMADNNDDNKSDS